MGIHSCASDKIFSMDWILQSSHMNFSDSRAPFQKKNKKKNGTYIGEAPYQKASLIVPVSKVQLHFRFALYNIYEAFFDFMRKPIALWRCRRNKKSRSKLEGKITIIIFSHGGNGVCGGKNCICVWRLKLLLSLCIVVIVSGVYLGRWGQECCYD